MSRWRSLRAPVVALAAAWSAVLVAIACVPTALVGVAVAAAELCLGAAPATSAVLLCAAPIAVARVLLGARGALGLLDADLVRVARARAEVRWDTVFGVVLIVAMLGPSALAGRVDGFAVAGVAWACVALAQGALLALAARVVGARLRRLLPVPPDPTCSPLLA